MVDYEFQARRIGRMSDYIDRRTATLGLHMACLEQQARELRRDAENMRRVVIGGSVDSPARMAGGHGTALNSDAEGKDAQGRAKTDGTTGSPRASTSTTCSDSRPCTGLRANAAPVSCGRTPSSTSTSEEASTASSSPKNSRQAPTANAPPSDSTSTNAASSGASAPSASVTGSSNEPCVTTALCPSSPASLSMTTAQACSAREPRSPAGVSNCT